MIMFVQQRPGRGQAHARTLYGFQGPLRSKVRAYPAPVPLVPALVQFSRRLHSLSSLMNITNRSRSCHAERSEA